MRESHFPRRPASRWIVIVLLAIAVAPHAFGQLPVTGEWISLFDGRTLDGWRVEAKEADRAKRFWKVEGGLLICDSRARPDHDYVWLIHEREFADFQLRLKVRGFRDSPGNSGVQVRSRWDQEAQWLDGPQVDIHPPAPWRTGLIYDETRQTRRWIFPSLKNWEIDASQGPVEWKWKYAGEGDGWNDIDVLCLGARIRTTVNGVPIADFDGDGVLNDEAHRRHNVGLRGHIALQLHARDELLIHFKDIAVKPLRAGD
ncbi:MAG: DUF1080 domain-containing protein [Bryobacteraceae bacterium]|nr:DUF1080 domain-containing protein [Bryobacteraceae bacterium]